jgi:hypothetical protein
MLYEQTFLNFYTNKRDNDFFHELQIGDDVILYEN